MGQELFNVVAVIPSLNPDNSLIKVVTGLIDVGFTDIILVDDGSHNECKKYFKELEQYSQCTVLTHAVNMGKGRALKTAFNYYLNNYDTSLFLGVVTADADAQHLPKDVKSCANCLLETPQHLILGTRNFSDKDIPFKSKFGNQLTTFIFRVLYGEKISDTQTGLRAIPNAFLEKCLTLEGERFEYEIQMLIKSVRDKVPVSEIMIDTVYIDGNRETHFHPLKDSARIYKVIFSSFFKYILSSLFCFIVDQGLFRLFLAIPLAFEMKWKIGFSTLFSRVLSALVNYTINKNVVFQTDSKNGSEGYLLKYALLCVIQMCLSWICVSTVYALTSFDISLIKLVVDSILFVVSYQVQERWVFKRRNS